MRVKIALSPIPSILVSIASAISWAGEPRFENYRAAGEISRDSPMEVYHPLESAKSRHDQGERWNPALKYAAVILAAGMGTFLIYNAFSPVLPRGECDEAELSEGPCMVSPVVGGVVGGLSLYVIAAGIAVRF